ncbi:MAG: DUF1697 domain-containing protein [Myxococcales bacterium]|nr:DUF1697 domain-containing protein [Myxococcales bacterium]
MGRHVILLRGVNVGGNNKLPMAALAALLTELGCTGVRTYIQSGNAVVDAGAALAKRLPAALAAAISSRLGLTVPVVVRTAAELAAVTRANPFLARGADPATLHVGFLADAPTAARIAALDHDRSPPDAFAVHGRELYLWLPNGAGKSKLTNAYFDRALATVVTVRNWNTVGKLIELSAQQM